MNKRRWVVAISSLVILVAIRAALALWWPAFLGPLQWALFLGVCVGLLILGSRTGRWPLPRWVVISALGAMLVSSSIGYSVLRTRGGDFGTVYVTRLRDDPNGAGARILREAIDEGVRVYGVLSPVARQLYRGAEGGADLSELFDRIDGESGFVWGSNQLVRFSPLPKVGRAVGDLVGTEHVRGTDHGRVVSARLSRLRIVADIPTVGLSFDPARGTGEFIAALTLASRLEGLLKEPGVRAQYQELLAAAARLTYRWRSSEHRAYPYFLLGTDQIAEYLQGGGAEPGLLECANRNFKSARLNLARGGNPQLIAAVRNNAAIASALLSEAQAGVWQPALRKELTAAAALAQRKDPFGAHSPTVSRLIRGNLDIAHDRSAQQISSVFYTKQQYMKKKVAGKKRKRLRRIEKTSESAGVGQPDRASGNQGGL